MKKLTFLLVSFLLVFNMSGCFTLIKACSELQKKPDTPPIRQELRRERVSAEYANGFLNGIKLGKMFKSFDVGFGYTYGTDYESFVFTKNSPSSLVVTVVPDGKEYPSKLIMDADRVDVEALKITYSVNRVRHEDFYSYKTIAMVSTIDGSGAKAHVRYEYISKSSECELIPLIYALFEVV